MKKFALIGAGSLQFTTSCVRDLLTFPAFEECEIRLMDINKAHLDYITKICEKITQTMQRPRCRIVPTMDRIQALKGADGVLCTVSTAISIFGDMISKSLKNTVWISM